MGRLIAEGRTHSAAVATGVAWQSSLRWKARRKFSTASVRRAAALMGHSPTQGWSLIGRETYTGLRVAGPTWTVAATRLQAVESYLSSIQRARRRCFTVSVRKPAAPMGQVP